MTQKKTTAQHKQDTDAAQAPVGPQTTNVTSVDVQLAAAYYPLLVEIAGAKQRVSYGELLARAKLKYPDSTVVQKAIAVSTGRRLDVVRHFTNARGLPDLTSLVINQDSGEGGVRITRSVDPEAARDALFEFDWSTVAKEFGAFVKQSEAATKHRKTVKEPAALELMAAHYREHKDTLPANIRDLRQSIVEMIMEGFTAVEAFERAMQKG